MDPVEFISQSDIFRLIFLGVMIYEPEYVDLYVIQAFVVWLIEVPRYFMIFFLVFHQVEVTLEAFLHSVHGLSYILLTAFFAGYAVYQVVAGTVYIFSGGVGATSAFGGYFPRLV